MAGFEVTTEDLFFPAALILLMRWAKRRAIQCLWLAVIISFLLNIWATHYDPSSAFYIFVPRAWELLSGSLLAFKAVPFLERRISREVAGLTGLGLIAWAVCVFTREMTFPGWRALFPCCGAWLIIYAGENGPSSVRTILSFKPLVFIGVISYSLYLWHWPIIVFARYFSAAELSAAHVAIAIILSLMMAFISFELIESPFRGGNSPINRRQIFSLGLATSVLSTALGFVIYSHHGFPGRYDDLTRQLVVRNTDRKSDYQAVCSNWRKEFRSMADIDFCTVGSPSSKKIMFWGDSHVQQLYPLIEGIHDYGGLGDHGAVFAIAVGCPPTEHMNYPGRHCDSFAHLAITRAEEEDVDTVFIGFATWWFDGGVLCPSVEGNCVGNISREEVRQRFFDELSEEIHKLKMHGKRVIVSLPFPAYNRSIPDLEIRNAVFGRFGLRRAATELTSSSVSDQVASVANSMGADIFDPRKSICPNQNCITELGGVSIYIDDTHIAASQIGILKDDMERVLR